MRRYLSHWILAALLIIAQTALLVHQADIDAHTHDGHCSACLLVHGLDNAVPHHQFVLRVDDPEHASTISARPLAWVRPVTGLYQTRAPPAYIHHS